MSGRPSQTPTFAPTNQPVAMEAPPVASSKPAPRVTVILGLVLASVAVCGAVAVFVFRKYRHSRPQRVPKQETEDAENSSVSRVVANSETNKRDELADAIDRSFRLFPRLLDGKSREKFGSISVLKRFLRDKVEDVLLDEPTLCERRNGPALFLRLGIDEQLVEKRFTALMHIEKELGIVGKSSFVDTIDLLIENIEFRKHFGEVNDKIQDLTENFSHLCVRMERGNIFSAIDTATKEIQRKGWGNLFMHGTKAAVPVRLTKEPKKNQLAHSRSSHDFGLGLYCFRGDRSDLIAALSFAVNRSFIYGENPCVIAFQEPLIGIDKRIIDVNREKIRQRQLSSSLGDVRYGELVAAQNDWTADAKNWKTALCITRWYGLELAPFYKNCLRRTILMGWLHDASTTEATDEGAHPRIDAEEWIQYFVKDLYLLGEKKLFIEFDVSKWEQWASERDVDRNIMVAWRNHMAENVALVP